MKKFVRQTMMASALVIVLTMSWALPIARADETDASAPATEEVTAAETGDAPASEPAATTEPEAAAQDVDAPADEILTETSNEAPSAETAEVAEPEAAADDT